MIGTKEICALLLAGSMGAGSVIGVQQVKPAVVAKAKPRAKAPVRKAAVRKPAAPAGAAARPAQVAQINDCPVYTAPLGPGLADLTPLPSMDPTGMGGGNEQYAGGNPYYPPGGYWPGWNHGGGGGGGNGITPDPDDNGSSTPGGGEDNGDNGGSIPGGDPVPGVPQPASWVMMIAGFGLVGLALRRSGGDQTEAAAQSAPHIV